MTPSPRLPRYARSTAKSMACIAAGAATVTGVPSDALAAFGPYPHGYGMKSLGMGGVGYTAAEDSYPLTANPAQAGSVGTRADVGLDWIMVRAGAAVHDNLLGPDQTYASHARNFPIPQAGFALPLSGHSWLGISAFAAGLGTDYRDSPYARFGGDEVAQASIGQSGISTALAYEVSPKHLIGVSVNLSYQLLDIGGLGALALFSEDPQHVTDQGIDGAFGAGYSIGWIGELGYGVQMGAAYRSKQWSQRFDKYAGLLPDRGRFELPAQYGIGVSWRPSADWLIATEVQRQLFSDERATGNSVAQLYEGQRLGSRNGPGFGWNDLTIFRLGLGWQASRDWLLRAGFATCTQPLAGSETLLNALGPNTMRRHYTLGFTYDFAERWEVTGYGVYAPSETVQGRDSLPLLLGDGEIDATNGQHSFGFSIGYRFEP